MTLNIAMARETGKPLRGAFPQFLQSNINSDTLRRVRLTDLMVHAGFHLSVDKHRCCCNACTTRLLGCMQKVPSGSASNPKHCNESKQVYQTYPNKHAPTKYLPKRRAKAMQRPFRPDMNRAARPAQHMGPMQGCCMSDLGLRGPKRHLARLDISLLVAILRQNLSCQRTGCICSCVRSCNMQRICRTPAMCV